MLLKNMAKQDGRHSEPLVSEESAYFCPATGRPYFFFFSGLLSIGRVAQIGLFYIVFVLCHFMIILWLHKEYCFMEWSSNP